MEIDKTKVRTLGDDEKSEMDRANDRVDAEMKLIESEAKEQVAQGLQDENIAKEAKQLRREAEEDRRKIEEETE